ncbi:sigma(54) modulation protein [Salmonella enterica subsp. enterica]|nr:sigma(54) modulation protein [Salmonella enterica subsp. enterica] [Salmonella enterica subsp. enterica serovar Menston]
MQLNITGHNVEITEALREFVTTKFAKLEQYFERINQVYVVLKVEKVTHISDATLHVNGGEIHASAEGQDMYAAIDGLIDKLARQLTRHKDKTETTLIVRAVSQCRTACCVTQRAICTVSAPNLAINLTGQVLR